MANYVQNLQAAGAANVHVGNNINNYNESTLHRCLADLRLTDPRDDKSRIQGPKDNLHKSTYEWILSHTDYQKWANNEGGPLLWIQGDAGKGKTMLLCGIINELEISLSEKTLLSFFFCQAANEDLNKATTVLRGLMYMLVKQNVSLLEDVLEEYKGAGKELFTDNNAWQALSRLFKKMLRKMDPDTNLIIIIDALDECEDTSKLIDLIIELSTTHRVKFIVASRNLPHVEEQLEQASQARICLELNNDSISAAVDIYIQSKVDDLTRWKKLSSQMGDDVRLYLSENSNHTFLWVALVCKRLEDRTLQPWNLMTALRSFPPGLGALYWRMIKSIDQSDDKDRCYRVLTIMMTVYRPIELSELMCFVDWPEAFEPETDHLRSLIKICGSFLTLQDESVHFIHQSAKEFLLEQAKNGSVSSVRQDHWIILSSSVQAMSQILKRDIYDLRHPGISMDEFDPPNPNPLARVRYQCVYWMDHWADHIMDNYFPSQTRPEEPQESGTMYGFLPNHFLHWLESLSLLKKVWEGIASISKLLDLIQERSIEPQLANFVLDAVRFIQYHQTTIAKSPLQIYTSALIFSPEQSIVKRLFQGEEQNWATTNCFLEGWGPYIRSHHLFPADNKTPICVFSADVQLIAFTRDRENVTVCSVSTGELRRAIDIRKVITAIAFSPNSKLIAVASSSRTIRITDIETGEVKYTMKCASAKNVSMIFSSNSKLVVHGMFGFIQSWSLPDGIEKRFKFEMDKTSKRLLRKAYFHCLPRFSSDSRHLVSVIDVPHTSGIGLMCQIHLASLDTSYRNIVMDTVHHIVQSLAISHDSRFLAATLVCDGVRIWSIRTRSIVQTILFRSDCQEEQTFALAFSPTSTFLAVSSTAAIRVFQVATGKLHRLIRNYGYRAFSLVFASDSKLVSISPDGFLRVWLVDSGTTDAPLETTENHQRPINTIAFSPRMPPQLLITASADYTARLWDVFRGDCLQVIQLDSQWADQKWKQELDPEDDYLDLRYLGYPFSYTDVLEGIPLPNPLSDMTIPITTPTTTPLGQFLASYGEEHRLNLDITEDYEWVILDGQKFLRLPDNLQQRGGKFFGSNLVIGRYGKLPVIWFTGRPDPERYVG